MANGLGRRVHNNMGIDRQRLQHPLQFETLHKNFESAPEAYLLPGLSEEPSGRPCGDPTLQIASESSSVHFLIGMGVHEG